MKTIISLSSAEFAHSMVSIKHDSSAKADYTEMKTAIWLIL